MNVIVPWLLLSSVGLCWAQAQCDLPQSLRDEIRGYQPTVDLIISEVVNGPSSGVLYNDLADYVDTFGARQAGTENLENAIDDVIKRQQARGLEVSTHTLEIPKWTRGESSAAIVSPRYQKLTILTLGTTIGTPEEGITAEVVVVKNFDELEARKNEISGKIVLYNAEYVSYGATGVYRNQGPNRASLLGAAAVLVRSITPFSINSPHTGGTSFDSDALRIPAAAITLENANLIARLVASGKNVTVNFKSSARIEAPTTSRNVIGDIVGATKPQEYVVISGHIDSWDVGQGAMDDGGGAFLGWHSLALINALGLPPPARTIRSILWTAEESGILGAAGYRRDREEEARNWTVAFESDEGVWETAGGAFLGWHSLALIKSLGLGLPARTIRAILWTAEEQGAFGALGYRRDREDEARNWTAAFESDLGVWESVGIGFSGSDTAACIMQEIVSLFKAINATEILREDTAGSDISQFQDLGVPLGEPYSKDNNYFWFHHSEGDWMDVLKSEDLDQNLAIFASTTYILANLSIPLPRD